MCNECELIVLKVVSEKNRQSINIAYDRQIMWVCTRSVIGVSLREQIDGMDGPVICSYSKVSI